MAATLAFLGWEASPTGVVFPRWPEPLGSPERLRGSNLEPGFAHGICPIQGTDGALPDRIPGQFTPAIQGLSASALLGGLGQSLPGHLAERKTRNRLGADLRPLDGRCPSTLADHAIPGGHPPDIALPHGGQYGGIDLLLHRRPSARSFWRGRLFEHPLALEPPKEPARNVPSLSDLAGRAPLGVIGPRKRPALPLHGPRGPNPGRLLPCSSEGL